MTIDGGIGSGTVTQTLMNTGGGAIMIGKGYEDFNDPPRICLTNGDTLYVTSGSSKPNGADAVTANLKVKDLTATGMIHLTTDGLISSIVEPLADLGLSMLKLKLTGSGIFPLMRASSSTSVTASEATTNGAADDPQLSIESPNATILLGQDNDVANLYRTVKTMNGVDYTVLETDNPFVCTDLDCQGLAVNSNAGVTGSLSLGGTLTFNNDAKMTWVNTSTLAVQDSGGSTNNGGLDVGSIFVNNLQPLNSGSPAGININCPLSFAGSRGTSGQVLTSNGSGSSPTWQTLGPWNGGTVTNLSTFTAQVKIRSTTGGYPALGSYNTGVGLIVTNGDPAYGLMMGTDGAGYGWIQQARVDGTATAYDLYLQPNGGNVRSFGNLGVGCSPTGIGTNYGTVDVRGSSGGGMRCGVVSSNHGGIYSDYYNLYLFTSSTMGIQFYPNNVLKAWLDTSGNLTIRGALSFDSTASMTSSAYQILPVSNTLYFNVPSGKTFAWSIAGGSQMSLDSGNLNIIGFYAKNGTTVVDRYVSSATTIGVGDNGYFYDDGSVILGKNDYSKTITVRGGLITHYNTLDDNSGNGAVAGNWRVQGTLTVWQNIACSGAISLGSSNYLLWGTDTYISRPSAGCLSVNNGSGSLGALNVSDLFADFINSASGGDLRPCKTLRMYDSSSNNIMPYSNNVGNIGGNGISPNWYWGSVWANYLKYHSGNSSFDAYDDMDLVRKMKTKKDEESGKDVIDETTLKHLQDDHGFYDVAHMNGWHLSLQRRFVEKHDDHDREIADLKTQIVELKSRLDRLTAKGGVSA